MGPLGSSWAAPWGSLVAAGGVLDVSGSLIGALRAVGKPSWGPVAPNTHICEGFGGRKGRRGTTSNCLWFLRELPGCSSGPRGSSWAAPGNTLVASREVLGSSLGLSCGRWWPLGTSWATPWGSLVAAGGLLDVSWSLIGALRAVGKASWAPVAPNRHICDGFGGLKGRRGTTSNCPWFLRELPGCSLGPLGRPWAAP